MFYLRQLRIETKLDWIDKMHTEFLMGNVAIAMGAIAAGLNVVSGYPGTPSTGSIGSNC